MQPDIALPQPHDPIARLGQVGVLGPVERHPAALPGVRLGELRRVSVPVVAVELHHDPVQREQGVNAEFAGEQRLPLVQDAEAVQHGIPSCFKLVRAHAGLSSARRDEACSQFWVGIPTFHRAVAYGAAAIGRLLLTGRRPAERLAAYLAGVRVLVSALPKIGVLSAAKVVLSRREQPCLNIVQLPAPCAWHVPSALAQLRPAFERACRLIGKAKGWLPFLAADRAVLFWQPRGDALARPAAELGGSGSRAIRAKLGAADLAGQVDGAGRRRFAGAAAKLRDLAHLPRPTENGPTLDACFVHARMLPGVDVVGGQVRYPIRTDVLREAAAPAVQLSLLEDAA